MLSKPRHGWTDFSLSGTSVYGLSYLDDIAFEWIGQAIHGLETANPFCVKGSLEPGKLLCTVSCWNCHIIIEDEGTRPLEGEDFIMEHSPTSMIDFCRNLYSDISGGVDGWASFANYRGEDSAAKKKRLLQMLERLKTLILEQEVWFGPNRYFF